MGQNSTTLLSMVRNQTDERRIWTNFYWWLQVVKNSFATPALTLCLLLLYVFSLLEKLFRLTEFETLKVRMWDINAAIRLEKNSYDKICGLPTSTYLLHI